MLDEDDTDRTTAPLGGEGSNARSRRKWTVRRRALVGIGGLLGLCLVALNACSTPLRVDPVRRASGEPVTDEHLELARQYAPWIYHAVHPTDGRQDLPAPVDFDGDLDGENNWESFPHFELVPTVYYACLESGTHWFLTYHLFHPRDWTTVDLGLHMTHEGDGENLQVVVEKASGQVVLLFTQAHYRGGVYAHPGGGFGDGEERVRGPLLLLDDAGRPSDTGRHAGVFVEWGGHGIYGALDSCAEVSVSADGVARFDGGGMVLRPRAANEVVVEPAVRVIGTVAYQLESTTAKLWPRLVAGTLVGEGRLLDGPVTYTDANVTLDLPRYYEANRFSGPFGPDRGISPFAVDFGFCEGDLGALFFDPARRYADLLATPDDWSLDWIDYPFTSG